ncbi:MAG: serine/threonine-protein kinase [Myxococcota bacterium]
MNRGPMDVEGRRILARARERLFGTAAEPTTVDRFVIVRQLGRGGMGVVYEAFDPELSRTVALKLVRPAAEPALDADRRLLREAQALAKLSHPNVVSVYRAGTHEGQVFIAMERIEGMTLRHWLGLERRATAEILGLFTKVGRGVLAAHRAGIIHRDLKPENILVDAGGEPVILDFGLAHRGPSGVEVDSDQAVEDTQPLTRPGHVLGTPAYMAPEQFRGGTLDERTDQFAFCVCLYEALFDQRPFGGSTVHSLREAIVRGDCAAPKTPRPITTRVRAAMMQGLQAEPSSRHASMAALLAGLSERRGRRSWWIAGPVVAAAAVLGAVALPGDDACAAPPVAAAPVVADPAAAWTATYVEACRRHHEAPAAWALVRRCLAARATELEVLAEIAEHGETLTEPLPPLDECTDVAELARRIDGDEARVAGAKQRLARGRALRSLGRPDEAAEIATEVRDQARRTEQLAVVARASALLGQARLDMADVEGGRRASAAAVWAAVASRHDALAVSQARTLAELAPDADQRARWDEMAKSLSQHR